MLLLPANIMVAMSESTSADPSACSYGSLFHDQSIYVGISIRTIPFGILDSRHDRPPRVAGGLVKAL
jgi:hypothetical protein